MRKEGEEETIQRKGVKKNEKPLHLILEMHVNDTLHQINSSY